MSQNSVLFSLRGPGSFSHCGMEGKRGGVSSTQCVSKAGLLLHGAAVHLLQPARICCQRSARINRHKDRAGHIRADFSNRRGKGKRQLRNVGGGRWK